ncbi:MAG: hypothetical protein JJE25_14310 [Bacteroidia bacterium]|nr:hypothetical protein [Bacteroidia bacterium]
MKKLTVYLMTVLLSLTFIPVQVKAGAEPAPTSMPASAPAESAQAKILLERLNEIKALDRSKLSSSEKKELRKEVRSTKKQLKELSGGIYLSVGAVIIIILLLILLL